MGNRLTKDDSVEGLTTYTYDQNDRLLTETTAGITTTYTYDDNGNLLSEVSSEQQTIYTWSDENRLIGAEITTSEGTQQIEYTYDADGIRVAKTVDGDETRYLIDANRQYAQVLEEYDAATGTEVAYVYGGNELISQAREGGSRFYLYDSHSGTRQLTDDTGAVTDSYLYDAYGNVLKQIGDTENSYLYRGEQTDSETGLQYLRARYNDFGTGRLISVDPFEGMTDVPMSRHRYMYGYNNPLMYVDPSGEIALPGESPATLKISSILGEIAATFGSAYGAQVYVASTSPAETIWDGKLNFYGNSNFAPADIAGIPGGMLSGGAGFLSAQTVGYKGNWALLGGGITGGITGTLPAIVNANTTITSPNFAGKSFITLSGEFTLLGTAALGGATGTLTSGFGRGTYFTSGANPGSSNGIGAYTGLSIPLGPFRQGIFPNFPLLPS